MDAIKNFLNEYNNENLQSVLTDENVHPKIVSNFCLDQKDVYHQVIDWILNHLESRKCPYQLAVSLAKTVAKEMDIGISQCSQENEKSNQEKLLNSVMLYNEVIKKLPTVCKTFLEQNNDQELCSSSYSPPYATSTYAIKNKRRKMEDRHVVHHDLNLLLDLKGLPAHHYYAVFDGHNGVDAASYASAHLHVNIAQHPAFLTDTPTAITEAYRITNENFLRKCTEENLKSGSTAITALRRENTVYLSWLGDAQAVVVKGGSPTLVTDPHKPDRPGEKKRIESLGGEVTFNGVWRVNGILAVTRAIGDPDHRPFISSEPETITLELDGTEDFLILASDGLWDVMTPENVTSTLYYNLKESALDEPLDAVAAKLVHQSKLLGSEDNTTVMVVFLRDIKTVKDYASEFSNHSAQLNFLEMNGEGKEAESVSFSKPTVLELNSASAKKMKNAANVLSSAGFNYQCMEGSFEGVRLNNSGVEDAVFVAHRNLASCLAPEATALSELPTPPIDEVMASQMCDKLSPAELHQGLSSLSADAETDTALESFHPNAGLKIQNFETTDDQNSNLDSVVQYPESQITPDEAADIASSVVSSTIETAVRHLSSTELYEAASQASKLNPYAKPFIPGEAPPPQSGMENSDHDVSTDDTKISNQPTVVDVEEGSSSNEAILKSESSVQEYSTEANDSRIALNNNVPGREETTSVINEVTTVIVDSLSGPDKTKVILSKNDATEQNLIECEELIHSKTDNKEHNVLNLQDTKESNLISGIVCDGISLDQLEHNSSKPSNFNLESIKATHSESVESSPLLEPVQLNLLDFDSTVNTVSVKSLQVDDSFVNETASSCISENFNISSEVPAQEVPVTDQSLQSNMQTLEEFILEKASLELSESAEKHIEMPVNKLLVDSVADMIDSVSTLCQVVSNQETVKNLESGEKENCSLLDLANNTGVFDNVPFIALKEELVSIAAALPSDAPDELPAEPVAVDLKTLPDGIPEAEGVTEDVDSDSEKDGGWSYMKVASNKPKSEPMSKGETQTSKVKIDTKLVSDNKTKGKSVATADKSRKPVEKQGLDAKEKAKPKTISSTTTRLAVDKTAKTSTVIRVKKEVTTTATSKISSATTSKISTAASANKTTTAAATSKPTRPTTLRNPNPAVKASATTTVERKPTLNKTGINISANGSTRLKTTTASNTAKAPVRVTSASSLSSKASPLNQNKSSTTGLKATASSRPLTATVPSRPLTKSSTLSKPSAVPDTKLKLPSTTLRKAEPKKPDVKETKDIANKQILARKNVSVGTVRIDKLKNTTTATRNAMTLNNKPVPTKTQSAPGESKKEVPKPATSKIMSKTSTAKVSQNASKAKPKDVKVNSAQDKIQTKKIEVATESKQIPIETPVCEKEKFLLEANDKEIISKENSEASVNSDEKPCLENGIERSEPLENIAAPITSELDLI